VCNAFMICVMACSSDTSGHCALRQRNLQKKLTGFLSHTAGMIENLPSY
jgi:hypothetical protein